MFPLRNQVACFFAVIFCMLACQQKCAAQASCADSSFQMQYSAAGHNLNISIHSNTADGGTLMLGRMVDQSTQTANIVVIKVDDGGAVVWAKSFESTFSIFPQKILELVGGEIIVYAHTSAVATPGIVLFKLDSGGNMLWGKIFRLDNRFATNDQFFAYAFSEGKNGDVLFTWRGQHFENNLDSSYAVACRIDKTGALKWSRAFVSTDDVFTNPAGIYAAGEEVFIFGQVNDTYPACVTTGNTFFAMRLDYGNGRLLQSNSFCYSEDAPGFSSITFDNVDHFNTAHLQGGNFSMFGVFRRRDSHSYGYKIVFDKRLNPVGTKIYAMPLSISYANARMYVVPNGDVHFYAVHGITRKNYWAVLDSSSKILRQRKLSFAGVSSNYSGFRSFAQKGDDVLTFTAYAQVNNLNTTTLTQLRNSDESLQDCLGTDTAFIKILPFEVSATSWQWKYIVENPVISFDNQLATSEVVVNQQSLCKQISRCEKITIAGPDTVCVLGQDAVYSIQRNKECKSRVLWQTAPEATFSTTQENDTTLRIRFKNFAPGIQRTKIFAGAGSCASAKDTLDVVLLPIAHSLPNDTTLCDSQELKLTPGNWFKNYLWQDGSTDSVFFARGPGKYFVQATAYCGYRMADTINIAGDASIKLTGPVLKCLADTVLLKASGGFKNYQWASGQNFLQINDSVIAVHNQQPQQFAVQAQTAAGCWAKDSLLVAVSPTPQLSLDADTALCIGESVELKTASFFRKYLWSTGARTQSITVSKAGSYWLQITSNEGCIARDTIRVLPKNCGNPPDPTAPSIHFPNAFTPDGDGLNDVFKASVKGTLEKYSLTVYNRWGGIVFRATNAEQGWNGALHGQRQDSNMFLWTCTYRFAGRSEQTVKGSILLLH